MIERYTRPEMGALWTDEARFASWLEVELAVVRGAGRRGIDPGRGHGARSASAPRFDPARIAEIEAEVGHDVIAFLDERRRAGRPGRAPHPLRPDLVGRRRHGAGAAHGARRGPAARGPRRAARGAAAPGRASTGARVMVGRTHGIHAEPYTLGLKFAGWYAEAGRNRARLAAAREEIRSGKISGAVGTYAHLGPDVEAEVLARLGLAAEPSRRRSCRATATPCSWRRSACWPRRSTGSRPRSATCSAPTCARSRSRSRRARRARRRCRTSATRSAARTSRAWRALVRAHVQAALENVALWHERDISHSSVERVILPDATILCDYMLARMTRDPRRPARLPRAHAREPGAHPRAASTRRRVLLALTAAGLDARGRPTRSCSATRCGRGPARATSGSCSAADPEVRRRSRPDELAACFDSRALPARTSTRSSSGCSATSVGAPAHGYNARRPRRTVPRPSALERRHVRNRRHLRPSRGLEPGLPRALRAAAPRPGVGRDRHARTATTLARHAGMGHVADVFSRDGARRAAGARARSATCATRPRATRSRANAQPFLLRAPSRADRDRAQRQPGQRGAGARRRSRPRARSSRRTTDTEIDPAPGGALASRRTWWTRSSRRCARCAARTRWSVLVPGPADRRARPAGLPPAVARARRRGVGRRQRDLRLRPDRRRARARRRARRGRRDRRRRAATRSGRSRRERAGAVPVRARVLRAAGQPALRRVGAGGAPAPRRSELWREHPAEADVVVPVPGLGGVRRAWATRAPRACRSRWGSCATTTSAARSSSPASRSATSACASSSTRCARSCADGASC